MLGKGGWGSRGKRTCPWSHRHKAWHRGGDDGGCRYVRQDPVLAAGAQGGTGKRRPCCQLQGHTASPTFGDWKAAPLRQAMFVETCRERP